MFPGTAGREGMHVLIPLGNISLRDVPVLVEILLLLHFFLFRAEEDLLGHVPRTHDLDPIAHGAG